MYYVRCLKHTWICTAQVPNQHIRESLTAAHTWHACKYKVHKLHQRYSLKSYRSYWVTVGNSGLCCCTCVNISSSKINSLVCWFCMSVLGLILFQICAQVPFWWIDGLIDWCWLMNWLIDVDWLIDWLIGWCWLMNWLIDVDWLIDWLIDWCCFRRTHYLPFATTWTRLSPWCAHSSLMWQGPVLTPRRRSRWSIETDFSLASQAGGLLKQTFLLQVKRVVCWNRLFSCKSSGWSVETDFSLASQAGGLLKQTVLLHIKQVVYWNRLFSCKSSRWSVGTDCSLASQAGGLLKQTVLLQVKQVVCWNRLFSCKSSRWSIETDFSLCKSSRWSVETD